LTKELDADISTNNQEQIAHELLDLYCLTHKLGAGKGVGGLREVQPGDELLMLCSTVLRLGVLNYRKKAVLAAAQRPNEVIRLASLPAY
jgi:hypothetical protein